MPTYSYACRDCDHRFDLQQAFTDDALTTCPACGGALRKVYGSVGVVFKGSGFYRTDSRASGGSTSAATPASPKGPAKAGADGAAPAKDSGAAPKAAGTATSSTASGGSAAAG